MKKNTINRRSYLDLLQFDDSLLKSPMASLLKNIRIVFLAVLALIVAGIASFTTLPRELNPEINIPIVTVVTVLPGADPLDVEELITDPLEAVLADADDLDRMTSSSQPSVSAITLEFESTVDIDKALQDVKDRVDTVTDLPDQSEVPTVRKVDFSAEAVWTVALVGTRDTQTLTTIAQTVADQLEKTSEIRAVELSGEQVAEIKVEVAPEALAEYAISLGTVESAIRTGSVKLPAGTIHVNDTEYQLSFDTKVTTVQDIRNIQVPISSSTSLPLSEIASVYETVEDTNAKVTYFQEENDEVNTTAAIQLSVFKSNQASISDAADVAETEITRILGQYDGVEFVSLINAAEEVEDSFNDLSGNFQSTILLVFLILFLFLGFRQAAIASLSIPLTFLSTFIIMQMLGITLNFLSLFSLLLALGLVVDDAIVIVQASSSYAKKFPPTQAGLLVFRDFVVPIWTTTITTIWAFVPLLLSTGIIGEFIKSIPIVVTATLLSSTAIAVLINLPATVVFSQANIPPRVKWLLQLLIGVAATVLVINLASDSSLTVFATLAWFVLVTTVFFARKTLQKELFKYRQYCVQHVTQHALYKKTVSMFDRGESGSAGVLSLDFIVTRYKKVVTLLLNSKRKRIGLYFGLALFFIFGTIVFPMTGLLKVEFFPKTDQDNIFVTIEGAPGWQVGKTEEVLTDVATLILKEPEITEVVGRTGSVPNFQGSGGGNSGAHLGYLTIRLSTVEHRGRGSIEIAEDLRRSLAVVTSADIQVVELSGGPPAGADLSIAITGEDLQTLEEIAHDFARIVEELKNEDTGEPIALNVSTSLEVTPGQLTVTVDRTAIEEKRLSPIQVAGWLRSAVSGLEATSITMNDQDVAVTVITPDSSQNIDMLLNTPLSGPNGSYTVSEVATVSLETSPSVVTHKDGVREVSVSAAADKVSAPELLSAFEEAVADYQVPDGYAWQTGGVNEENQESTNSIIQAMGLSALLILITMVVQLRSFRQSFLVLTVIPLAVAGVFFNFTVFGIPLSFPALIGVLALFGIVVNNSIMLMEKINQNHALGLNYKHGIIDACSVRLEAIVFTSLTTGFGLLPITVSDPLWRGLGGAIIAGLSVSGILILVLLPALMVDVFGEDGSRE